MLKISAIVRSFGARAFFFGVLVFLTVPPAQAGTPNTNTLLSPSVNPAIATVGVPFSFSCEAYPPTGRTLARMDYYYWRDGAQISLGSLSGPGPIFTKSVSIPALPSNGTNDSIYCVAVTDWNQSIGLPSSRPISVSAGTADTQAPSIPSGLAATPSSTSANLSWSASSDNIGVTGYEVSINSGAAIAATGTTFSATGLTASTAYSFKVRSKDAAGNTSAYSSAVNFTTTAGAPGGTPNTNTLVTPSANPAIVTVGTPFTFRCDAYPPSGRTLVRMDYYYYRDGAQVSLGSVNGAGPSFTLSNATISALPVDPNADSIYCIAVTDWNQSIGIGGGRPVIVSAPSDVQAPTVPVGLASSSVTYQSANLSWSASSDNVAVVRYEIQTNSTGTPVSVSAPTLSRSMTGLSASTSYTFRVRACDSAGNCSAYSSNVSVTTSSAPVDTTAPSVPSGLSASPASTSATLTWSASTDNIGVTGYEVSINGGAVVSASTTSYSASGLNPSTTYNFKVRAKDGAGNLSAYSSTVNFTTTATVSSVPFSYGSALSVQLSASVQSSPASITLSWPSVTGAPNNGSISVYRKAFAGTSWGSAIATLASTATSFTDTNVTAGSSYEYQVSVSRGVGTAYGYILAGINAQIDSYKGRILILVDSSLQSLIQVQIDTLLEDLYGEGYIPIVQAISRTATPSSVRTTIQNTRTTYPDLNALYLIGHIPVPYAGNNDPDGHAPRSMSSDGYYGELTSTWNTSAGCTYNPQQATLNEAPNATNTFCNGTFPSALELQVGRVDMVNLTAFALPEVDLLRNYLDKAHAFKVGQKVATKRAFIKDHLGENGWNSGAAAWGGFSANVGVSNLTVDNLATTFSHSYLGNQSYLFNQGTYYGQDCAGSANAGIIGSSQIASLYNWGAVFNMSWGSYFGEFNCQNSFLRSLLNSGDALAHVYSSHFWFTHPMGLGQTVGASALLSMNNQLTGLYQPKNVGWVTTNHTQMGLMGDPSLRMEYIKPPSNVTVSNSGGKFSLTWTASSESGISGYHVYQVGTSGITRLTSSPVVGTSYTSTGNYVAGTRLVVRAVKLVTGSSGSYLLPSVGVSKIAP